MPIFPAIAADWALPMIKFGTRINEVRKKILLDDFMKITDSSSSNQIKATYGRLQVVYSFNEYKLYQIELFTKHTNIASLKKDYNQLKEDFVRKPVFSNKKELKFLQDTKENASDALENGNAVLLNFARFDDILISLRGALIPESEDSLNGKEYIAYILAIEECD